MKIKFSSNAECCHVWASRSQETGTANNVHFENDTIFSFGWWPMARFLPDKNIVLFRNWSYSSYTGRHLNLTRQAIPDFYEIIYVYNPGEHTAHENINDYVKNIKESFEKFQTAKKYKGRYQETEQRNRQELKRYCKLFKCKYPAKEIKNYSFLPIKLICKFRNNRQD